MELWAAMYLGLLMTVGPDGMVDVWIVIMVRCMMLMVKRSSSSGRGRRRRLGTLCGAATADGDAGTL